MGMDYLSGCMNAIRRLARWRVVVVGGLLVSYSLEKKRKNKQWPPHQSLVSNDRGHIKLSLSPRPPSASSSITFQNGC